MVWNGARIRKEVVVVDIILDGMVEVIGGYQLWNELRGPAHILRVSRVPLILSPL